MHEKLHKQIILTKTLEVFCEINRNSFLEICQMMQQFFRRISMSRSHFNEITRQLYRNLLFGYPVGDVLRYLRNTFLEEFKITSQKKLWIEDFLNNLLINISDFIFSCVVNPVTLHEESNTIKRNVFENFYIKRHGQALWKILIKEFAFLFKSRLRPRPADLLKLSFVTTTSIRVWGKCSNCN